jgi:glycosyltransferase involved in cell wall biosynthesis
MKVVYLNHNVVGTGTFLRAYRLGCEVARRGHDVTVVTTSARARYGVTRRNECGVTVIEAPDLTWGRARTGWDPYNTLVRCLAAADGHVDIIHAFDSRPAVVLPALYLRRRTGAKLVMDWADWWGRGGTIVERTPGLSRHVIEPVETWFEERFRTEADLTTTICTPLLERVVSLGVPREHTRLVPNGCTEITRIEREEARRRLGIAADVPLLVHLGAAFRRDIDLMVQTFSAVRAQVPAAQLVFAGSLPVALAPAGGVRALGRVSDDDVALWLAAADVCVLPMCDTIANRGRWPSKVNEYLAAGRAIAITDVGDVASWIRDRGCGAVADASPAAFAQAIVDLLRSPDARVAAETNALALAHGPLSWSNLAQDVADHYEHVRGNMAVLSA